MRRFVNTPALPSAKKLPINTTFFGKILTYATIYYKLLYDGRFHKPRIKNKEGQQQMENIISLKNIVVEFDGEQILKNII